MRGRIWLVLALAACGYGPTTSSSGSSTTPYTPPEEARPAPAPAAKPGQRDRELIEKAYAAHDSKSLHELLDILTDKKNHAIARDYYIKLQLDALVALDCDPFFAAFEPVHGKPNPKTAFASLTTELDAHQKSYVATTVLGVAARCRSVQLFGTGLRRIVPDADDDLWAGALIATDKKGFPVYDVFMTALRAGTKQHMDAKLIGKWLIATKDAINCHELATATRTADYDLKASLEEFYAAKNCKVETAAR